MKVPEVVHLKVRVSSRRVFIISIGIPIVIEGTDIGMEIVPIDTLVCPKDGVGISLSISNTNEAEIN